MPGRRHRERRHRVRPWQPGVGSAESSRDDERLAFLAHEIRNLVGTASVAFEVLKTGNVGVSGSTGSVLQRSLSSLRELITRSVDDERLRHSVRDRTRFELDEFIAELAPAAVIEAGARGLTFHVAGGAPDARVDADRPVLTAVITNLLQNAFKFTRPGSSVTLRGSATAERVVIAVEDECGGLPNGRSITCPGHSCSEAPIERGSVSVSRCAGGHRGQQWPHFGT